MLRRLNILAAVLCLSFGVLVICAPPAAADSGGARGGTTVRVNLTIAPGTIPGDLTVLGDAGVKGYTLLWRDLTVTSDAGFQGQVFFGSDAGFSQNVLIAGQTMQKAQLTVTSDAGIQGQLLVISDAGFAHNVNIAGALAANTIAAAGVTVGGLSTVTAHTGTPTVEFGSAACAGAATIVIFSSAFASAPVCVASADNSGDAPTISVGPGTTGVTFACNATTTYWFCIGAP